MKKDWVKLRKIKGGHSYWRRIADGEIGICDDSGTYPEDCEPADRPPLLLDKSRPVIIGAQGNFVPLKHENGDTSITPVNGFEALWVVTTFLMEMMATEKCGETLRVRTASVETFPSIEQATSAQRRT